MLPYAIQDLDHALADLYTTISDQVRRPFDLKLRKLSLYLDLLKETAIELIPNHPISPEQSENQTNLIRDHDLLVPHTTQIGIQNNTVRQKVNPDHALLKEHKNHLKKHRQKIHPT